MNKANRIQTVKEALNLFFRSLPKGSHFSILSFGCNYEKMVINNQYVLKNDQKTCKTALERISKFEADLGRTNILDPIKFAIDMEWKRNGHKRIFMLTDGAVDNDRDELIE